MSTLFPQTINYENVTGGYVDGRWVENAPAVGTFQGSVQPLTDREIQALEVGREDLGKVKIYSGAELKVSVEGQANSGDVVIWQGKRWEIIQALNYQNNLIPHYKYIAEYREPS